MQYQLMKPIKSSLTSPPKLAYAVPLRIANGCGLPGKFTSSRGGIGKSQRTKLVMLMLLFVVGSVVMSAQEAATKSEPGVVPHRVYSHLLNPREHPDYDRRAVKPPTWDTFKNRTQFTCLRGFEVRDDQLVGFSGELEKYTRTHELGNVIWPSYSTLFATNLADLAEEIRRRDLYLFDIWGYVPGSGPGGYWTQFTPPASAFATLESKLGERWLGTDIGEQDGRYIGGYANQMSPASATRLDQYLNFQRHFERMGDDLGHKHATLVSLNFGHYFLKEGTYTLIGAETAQALPNSQVYYAFIRGAGRQYGVPWFGNASIFNRWGYKTYGSAGGSGGDTHSPTNGTSLSLLKRLLYSHILYNCVAVGFENGWFDGELLSPIGRIQQAAQRWVNTNGPPGAVHTPVAVLLDFYSGWSFPRHLYSGDIYRVWGNRPYELGDYFTDAVLDLIYPGYQNSSYFHDESGFLSPTPFGDIADCLLSDAPAWVLDRYPVVIVAGALGGGQEIRDKLQAYADRGGHVVITAGNLSRLPGGLAGCREVTTNSSLACGQGRVTILRSPFGVTVDSGAAQSLRSEIDKPLPKPYRLEPDARLVLENILRSQQLFRVQGEGLSFITCRGRAGEFTVGIANNTWQEQSFRLESLCGQIEALREIPIPDQERDAVGYTPQGIAASTLGINSPTTIAGGEVRIFAVKVRESGVSEISQNQPPSRPHGRLLPLRKVVSIKEEILSRPTFFEHFDGVSVDWRYFSEKEKSVLLSESRWLKRQGVRVVVDASSGINLYPGLRLIDNAPVEYQASVAAVRDLILKMEMVGARDLVMSLHRYPENNFTDEQTRTSFITTFKELSNQAALHGVTLHLRVGFGKPPWGVSEAVDFVDRVGARNFKLAISTALPVRQLPSPEISQRMIEKLGFWLVADVQKDASGKIWDAHAPIQSGAGLESLSRWIALSPGAPMVLDALLEGADAEYLEAKAVDKLLTEANRSASR